MDIQPSDSSGQRTTAPGVGSTTTFLVTVRSGVVATVPKKEGWQKALSDAIDSAMEEHKMPPCVVVCGPEMQAYAEPIEREEEADVGIADEATSDRFLQIAARAVRKLRFWSHR